MRHLKKDLQKAIEHFTCYTFNDIGIRTQKIEQYIDKDNNVKPGANELETKFREVMVEDYSALMQRYAVKLQPLFKYIKAEMPNYTQQLGPMEFLYNTIVEQGNFADGCKCPGCKKFSPEDK